MEWRSAGSRELFFFLLTEGRWVRREEIIDALWPTLEPDRGEKAFHSNAYRLRRALFKECLQHERGRFRLNPSVEFSYDVADFDRLVGEGARLPPGAERAARFRDAIALYRGPFLDEFYSEWCEAKRHGLEIRFLHALACFAGFLMERGEYRRAGELWERALGVDAYQEDALRKLMLCYSQLGDRSAALRQYQRWHETAQRDGIRPTAETQDLYQALVSGRDVLQVAVTS
jgi:two-component SAPR family response regulator